MASRFCVAVSSASTGSNAWGEVWSEWPDKRAVVDQGELVSAPTCFDLVQSQRQCLLQLRCSLVAHCQVKPLKMAVPRPTGSRRAHSWVLVFARLSTENITTFARLVITTPAKDGASEMVLGRLVVDQSNGGLTTNLAINLAVSPLKALMGRG